MMEKNYEKNPQKANYIKENLFKKYPEIFEKYEMDELSSVQVCNLAEFLIAEHPEKYDKSSGTRMDYENDENLQKIYAVIDKQKNTAVLINTNENGKVPEGEFGTYDLEHHKFNASDVIKENIKRSIREIANKTLTEKEIEEMVNEISPQNLDDMDKLATIGERNINERVRKAVDQKIDEKNEKNGKTKEDREELESRREEEQVVVGGKEGQEEGTKIPEDVARACKRLGVTQIKSYFYVNASELGEKIDGTRVNKNGNRVLMLEVADSSNIEGPNKYYGFQDNRMISYGIENQEVRDVTGNVTQLGKVVKPLKLQSPEFVEYRDSEGLVIREQIDEKADLSVQEMQRYKRDMEDLLEKYSQNIYMIKYNSNLSPEEKIEQIQKIDDWCDEKTTDIALENNVSMADDRNIDAVTDEHTEDIQEEIEAWEVPGKREIGE